MKIVFFIMQNVSQYSVLAVCDDLRKPVSLVVVIRPSQSEAIVSREPFELEPQNLTRTSTAACPTSMPDVMSPATSGPKSSRKKPLKMPHPTTSGGIDRERFTRGLPNFTLIANN